MTLRKDDEMDKERAELRALIDTLDRPLESRQVQSGYRDLCGFIEKRAARG